MVDLEERAAGGDSGDRPDRPNGSPQASGETCDLHRGPVPKASASAEVTAAHGQRLGQAVVQRGLPGGLQVSVGLDPEGHFRTETDKSGGTPSAPSVDDGNEALSFTSAEGSEAEPHSVFMSCET